jgi:(S)-2-hydroxyglutarate dehydrogenase
MTAARYDVAVIGGGIVGMATAMTLLGRAGRSLVVLEAEPGIGTHQTGHNSGVIHSGVYYRPGSLKARLCTEGRTELYRFCEEHGVRFERCGKIVVATREAELPRLGEIERRARANGLSVRRLSPNDIREREPHAVGLAALLVEETGIVDFLRVAEAMAKVVRKRGGEIRVLTGVRRVVRRADEFALISSAGELRCRNIINCAGLQSDRVARMCGLATDVRIIPFRGEYLHLRPDRRGLVRHLIYPVPDPDLPFLGQHFTRGLDGDVEVGPNAVLALARHGYRRGRISARDVAEMLRFPGFWVMGWRHWRTAVEELRRSLSVRRSVESVSRMLPELRAGDVTPGKVGVRAQAVDRHGRLLDDFHLVSREGMLHVLNAPSPAATASLAIGRYLAEQAAAVFR